MPYVKQEKRVDSFRPEVAGDLNFRLTQRIGRYLEAEGVHYAQLNRCIGILHRIRSCWTGAGAFGFCEQGSLRSDLYDIVHHFIIDGTPLWTEDRSDDLEGALTCCILELYRRMGAIMEDDACRRNGDVYPTRLLPTRAIDDLLALCTHRS